jgi:hypothetical protein
MESPGRLAVSADSVASRLQQPHLLTEYESHGRLLLSERKSPAARRLQGFFAELVAGVGFEPTTFRL